VFVAVCCSVLQCVAVRCSALQCALSRYETAPAADYVVCVRVLGVCVGLYPFFCVWVQQCALLSIVLFVRVCVECVCVSVCECVCECVCEYVRAFMRIYARVCVLACMRE